MTSNRKYAALPDLDSAPDIYETPELTDDQSTIPPTTVRSPSDNEYDEEEDDDATGVSRSRLRVNQARSRFMPATVDATDVDFSDRLSSKRKSYKTSTRRHRILEDGTEEIGDLSDEDDAGNLARKIARLKREIEEAKEEYGKQKAASSESKDGEEVAEGEFDSLSKVLDEMSRLDQSLALRAIPGPPPAGLQEKAPGEATDGVSYTITYAPSYEQTHALAKAADFDGRLVVLEKALGVGSAAMPEFDSNGLPRAIVPLLEHLHRQVSTLSDASVPSLDSISRRVRALTQEAESLEKARRNAKAAHEALASTGAAPTSEAAAPEDSEQTAKINALYGTLPTIENLTPLLPPLLDRLRSLRMIHADAATASETLARLEKKQAEMAGEMQQWREGLEKVEGAVRAGDAAMAKNVDVMSKARTMTSKPPQGHFNILYFASAGSYTSKNVEALPAPLPLRKLFSTLEERYKGIRASVLDHSLVTINLTYVDVADDEAAGDGDEVVIQEGDEVAIIPPVSSG
ncbi:Dynamitin-domain-containing protein [Chaetomidium leptoderma]|uniref:Molybdopterin synthase sulfur carrier subunit n=1 Tax=Chaetomidium leptoderma TaxID=669021 RepID=A0AAN6VTB4_9PEZI|nr:Dynamitin-domain-containing protein [Chaetomidium leptoderma]